MGRIEDLARHYEDHIGAPWQRTAAGAQRVTIVVYDKALERSLRARLPAFAQATREAGHDYRQVDCTTWFADWISSEEYRDEYFADPSLLRMKLGAEFPAEAARRLREHLDAAGESDVVALVGVAALFGFLRVSGLIHAAEDAIRGRLVVFFPGTKDGNNYRLLDARDGWTYMAHAITAYQQGARS